MGKILLRCSVPSIITYDGLQGDVDTMVRQLNPADFSTQMDLPGGAVINIYHYSDPLIYRSHSST